MVTGFSSLIIETHGNVADAQLMQIMLGLFAHKTHAKIIKVGYSYPAIAQSI